MSKHFMIYSSNESAISCGNGFWSNEFGWTCIEDATLFSENDRAAVQMPISTGGDAKWIPLDLDYSWSQENDPMTVAYMAIGFAKGYESMPQNLKEELSSGIGYPKLLSYVVNQSAFLIDVFDRRRDSFGSISFHTEIAERFGKEYAAAIVESDLCFDDEIFLNDLAVQTLKRICESALPQEDFKMMLSLK